MSTPQINISSLNFNDIKESLKTYISGIPEFNSLDYSASGINSLLDVFAYNTLYYAYYANMIANESFLDTAQLETNFLSLLKPLGVLLPGKSCATAEITANSSLGRTITSYDDYVIGFTNTNLTYRFFTIEDIDLDINNTTFKVYEGVDVAKDLELTVNLETQKVFVGSSAIDIDTLTVTVDGEKWEQYKGNNYVGPDSKVYFIDRTFEGFYILFGKRTVNDLSNNYGKEITASNIVKVSYIIPTGSSGNNVNSFSSISNATIVSNTVSAGGTNAPDLEKYRYSAPKIFAANDRAITKDDYFGLLFSSNLLPSNIDSENKINIWGGEENIPPSFGRVFISFSDSTINIDSNSVKSCISFLKKKSAITVLPEYIKSQIITGNLDIGISSSLSTTAKNDIKNIINSEYNTNPTFNKTIFIGDIKNLILQKYPSTTGININSIKLNVDVVGPNNKTIYIKNELLGPRSNTNYSVLKSNEFSYQTETVFLGDQPTKFDSDGNGIKGKLYLYISTSGIKLNNISVGNIDYKSGTVKIDANILPSSPTTITLTPKNIDALVFKNEIILNVNTTINGS